jgi:protein-S-isoprenylcysteine O-methyltransferase Ste14
MTILLSRLWRVEFEGRIFVSFTIAAGVMGLSYRLFPGEPSTLALLGSLAGLAPRDALRLGYACLALLFGLCSVVRMWAGSVLTPDRVMSFAVRTDHFSRKGPYRFVRNPIYWSDLSALTLIAACLPWPGLAMPALFYLHYLSIIRFEEASLAARHGLPYQAYMADIPRLLPTPRSLRHWPQALGEFHLTWDGVRHNALWILLVPGMLVAAVTLDFSDAILMGAPAVLDWAVVHTIIGVHKQSGLSNSGVTPGPAPGGSA